MDNMDTIELASGLFLRDDGVWSTREFLGVSYPSTGNDNCFEIEDRSFWFQHRNECIKTLVTGFPPPPGEAIFDVGGGNGYVARGLADAGFEVVVVEPGASGALNARKRGLKHVVCSTTDAAKFRPNSIPAVGLFDVVEHIEDDVSFMKSIHALLKTGGPAYITVPAYWFLWSMDDVIGGHFRRYTLRGICRVLEEAGFAIDFATYIFRPLPLPILLSRTAPYLLNLGPRAKDAALQKSARDHKEGLLASALKRFLAPEIKNLQAKIPMRFGGSCLVAARTR